MHLIAKAIRISRADVIFVLTYLQTVGEVKFR